MRKEKIVIDKKHAIVKLWFEIKYRLSNWKKRNMTITTKQKTKRSVFQTKAEANYLNLSLEFPKEFIQPHSDSKFQGFDIIFANQKSQSMLSRILQMGKGQGLIRRIKLLWTFIRLQRVIVKGIDNCFLDLETYLTEIRLSKFKFLKNSKLLKTYPNKRLWTELEEYCKKWNLGKIGFTELPTQLIFKNRPVLFKYALVFIQEMEKDKIDQAPDLVAGKEVMRVYKTLGLAVNDTARWLRSKGVRCQSNHPLGGLVNNPPLAGKAGLGWQGNNGLLITPQYGQRQRIAPILVENIQFLLRIRSLSSQIMMNTDGLRVIVKLAGYVNENVQLKQYTMKESYLLIMFQGLGILGLVLIRQSVFPIFFLLWVVRYVLRFVLSQKDQKCMILFKEVI